MAQKDERGPVKETKLTVKGFLEQITERTTLFELAWQGKYYLINPRRKRVVFNYIC